MEWEKAKQRISENPAVLDELKNNEAEYRIIREIIKARKEKNITQKELAELIGTRQSNISRLESGNYNPSLVFSIKLLLPWENIWKSKLYKRIFLHE